VKWLVYLFRRDPEDTKSPLTHALPEGTPLEKLKERVADLRHAQVTLDVPEDAVELTARIADLIPKVLPSRLAECSALGEERRLELAEAKDEWEFAEHRGPLPREIARSVLTHRQLWLASVLGTPKRVPLDDGLFDLVIFDEASQCDIASAMPLLARAKRAVIVGDDRQLSFIPQL
jgi:hypothetical protein